MDKINASQKLDNGTVRLEYNAFLNSMVKACIRIKGFFMLVLINVPTYLLLNNN